MRGKASFFICAVFNHCIRAIAFSYSTQSAMAIGMNAGKQLAFTAFALYMSGNSLHIFSIFALGMAIMSPINGLMGFSNAFARYSDSNVNLIVPKVLYVLSQLGGILLVLYKFNNLGLLPNSPIDLISSLPPPIVRLSLNDPHYSSLHSLSPSHSPAPCFILCPPPSQYSAPAHRVFHWLIFHRALMS